MGNTIPNVSVQVKRPEKRPATTVAKGTAAMLKIRNRRNYRLNACISKTFQWPDKVKEIVML